MARTDNTSRDANSRLAGGRPLTDAEILAQIPAARARAAEAQRHGLRAGHARYSTAHERIQLTLTNGVVVEVPVDLVPALRNASPRDLAAVEVTPTGSALHWERLDVDLSVPALVAEALGGSALMSVLGAAGGKATSPRKADAARANGARGGRPRGSGTLRSKIKQTKPTRREVAAGSEKVSAPSRPQRLPSPMKVGAKRASSQPRADPAKSNRPR